MSIFASREQKTLPIPFDAPHEVTIQKLSGKNLARASQVFLSSMIADVQARGGAAVMKDMQELYANPDGAAHAANVHADPLNGYDRHTLIRLGVVSWTYAENPKLDATIDDLDDDAVEFFATEILRLTKPSLFLTADEKQAARKND